MNILFLSWEFPFKKKKNWAAAAAEAGSSMFKKRKTIKSDAHLRKRDDDAASVNNPTYSHSHTHDNTSLHQDGNPILSTQSETSTIENDEDTTGFVLTFKKYIYILKCT